MPLGGRYELLYLGCCGPVAMVWSLTGRPLWVGRCGSVAVGRSLWVGRCGSATVSWSLWLGRCKSVAVS